MICPICKENVRILNRCELGEFCLDCIKKKKLKIFSNHPKFTKEYLQKEVRKKS